MISSRIAVSLLTVFVALGTAACGGGGGGSGSDGGTGSGGTSASGSGGSTTGGPEGLPTFSEPVQVTFVPSGQTARDPVLVAVGEDYGVAWSRYGGELDEFTAQIHLTRIDASGTVIWDTAIDDVLGNGRAAVAHDGVGFGVAFKADTGTGTDVAVARIADDGSRSGPTVLLSALTDVGATPDGVGLASSPGAFGLSWVGASQTDKEARFVRLDAELGVVGTPILLSDPAVHGSSSRTLPLWLGDAWGVVWTSTAGGTTHAYYVRLSADGGSIEAGPEILNPNGDGGEPAVAYDGEHLAAVWSDYGPEGIPNPAILFALFDRDGKPVVAPTRISTSASDHGPTIGYDGDIFTFVWYDDDPSHALLWLEYAAADREGSPSAEHLLREVIEGAPGPSLAARDGQWALAFTQWVEGTDAQVFVSFAPPP